MNNKLILFYWCVSVVVGFMSVSRSALLSRAVSRYSTFLLLGCHCDAPTLTQLKANGLPVTGSRWWCGLCPSVTRRGTEVRDAAVDLRPGFPSFHRPSRACHFIPLITASTALNAKWPSSLYSGRLLPLSSSPVSSSGKVSVQWCCGLRNFGDWDAEKGGLTIVRRGFLTHLP